MMMLEVCSLLCGGLYNVAGTALVSDGSFWVFSACSFKCTAQVMG